MILIGFTGKMGVGKSTAIECLRYLQPEAVHNIKFAQPLYDMQDYIYRRISSVYPRPANFVKDRKLLQWLGTDWGRGTIDESIWTKLWEAELAFKHKSSNPKAIMVCDDVRFDNEADVIHRQGGVVIRITKPDPKDTASTAGIASHTSEAGISENLIDFTVSNDDTVKALSEKLSAILKQLTTEQHTNGI